ncbi:MAG: dihydrofolate reductase family protein [Flavisolibacter sp.]
MGKLVVFMHITLDGKVAGPGGEMDWIHVDEEIFQYAGQETAQSETALYGRTTYEMMEAYWPGAADKPMATPHDIEHSNWYNKVTKVVLSKSMKGIHLPRTIIISDNLADEIQTLKQQAPKNILVFGSPSAVHSLLAENLIDEYWLFVNPVLLGQGVPLFKRVAQQQSLKLLHHKAFASGVVCLHYATGS